MNFWFSYFFMGICLVTAVAISIGGLFLVRKYAGHRLDESHHGVAGPFMSIVATLYAVVLGFIVVDSLNTFQKARTTVEMEANSFHDIFHLAQGLNEPVRSDLRRQCYSYADAMVNDEWAAMEYGKASPEGHQIYGRMWHDLAHYKPTSSADAAFLGAILDEMKDAGDSRHNRILAAQAIYDPTIWWVLGIGSVITIAFTYFFTLENFAIQVIMTALVTIVVTLNLVVVAMYDSPFSGDVKVRSLPFQADLDYFNAEKNGE